jgi:hypothetical protein
VKGGTLGQVTLCTNNGSTVPKSATFHEMNFFEDF